MLDREFRFTLRSIVRAPVIGPVFLGTLFCLFVATLYANWTTSSVASWVQAVGSVAAILVAVWVAELGHHRDRARADRAQLVEEVRVAWLAECALNEASAAIYDIRDQIQRNSWSGQQASTIRLQQANEMLRAVLQQALPHRVVNTVFVAIGAVGESNVMISSWHGTIRPAGWQMLLNGKASTVNACRVAVETEYQRLARLAGVAFTTRVRP